MSRKEIQEALELKHEGNFREIIWRRLWLQK